MIPPPLWETTIPTARVTLVIAATELCRVPMPFGSVTLLESTVMYRPEASMNPSPVITKAPSSWANSLIFS